MTTSYVTYQYYTTTFLGVAIASNDFSRLALRASAEIDRVTFNRTAAIVLAATDTETIDLIKMAACSVAEQIQTNEAEGGSDGIQSEQIGSNSVTYAENSSKRFSNIKKIQDAARLYLESTELMFAGFASGEYGGMVDED